jgi:hypothetical protein
MALTLLVSASKNPCVHPGKLRTVPFFKIDATRGV